MSRKLNGQPSGVAFDKERILALSTCLRKGPIEFETCVSGGSMGKALPEGSKIHVRFATENHLSAGQVITYVSKYWLVAHRLVQCVTSNDIHYLITRGDATVCCDVPVRTSAVIGIVTEFQNAGIMSTGRTASSSVVWFPIGGIGSIWSRS